MKRTYYTYRCCVFYGCPCTITMVVYVRAYPLTECYCFIHRHNQMGVLLRCFFTAQATTNLSFKLHENQRSATYITSAKWHSDGLFVIFKKISASVVISLILI